MTRASMPQSAEEQPTASEGRPMKTGWPALLPCRRRKPATHDAITVMTLVLLAGANLIGVYGSVPWWAVAALPATASGAALASGIPSGTPSDTQRYTGLRTVVGLAAMQCAAGPLIAAVADRPCRGEPLTCAYAAPTFILSAIENGWSMLCASFHGIIAAEAPVGTGGGSLMAIWTICLWSSFLACLAVHTHPHDGRFAALATATIAIEFVLCAMLGTADGTLPTAVGIAMALMTIRWLSRRRTTDLAHRPTARSRTPTACAPHAPVSGGHATTARLSVAAAALAIAVCALLPQHRAILRDRYVPDTPPYADTSPLSGMRAVIREHRDDVLLTVTGLPAGTAVRLAVMDGFDGIVWSPSGDTAMDTARAATENAETSSLYRPVSSSSDLSEPSVRDGWGLGRSHQDAQDGAGEGFTAVFTLHDGFEGHWLPVAGTVRHIDITDITGNTDNTDDTGNTDTTDTTDTMVYGNRRTGTFLVPSGLASMPGRDTSYVVDGLIAQAPSREESDGAQAAPIEQSPALAIPDAVERLARSIAGGTSEGGRHAGQAARLLAEWTRDHGWFSHGLSDDYPSLPGHGAYRLTLMTDGIMVGDSEQYASLMALMARCLDLPSRVVLGFVPHDNGTADDADTHANADDPDDVPSQDESQNGMQGDLRNDLPPSTVSFTGGDLEAWVEIALDGLGWVPFHPTPPRSQAFDGAQSGTADDNPIIRQPSAPLARTPSDDSHAATTPELDGERADVPSSHPSITDVIRIVGASMTRSYPLWLPVSAAAVIILLKAVRISKAKGRGPPRTRIIAAWRSVCELAVDSGVSLRGTRREQERELGRRFAVDPDALRRLRMAADQAAFAATAPNVLQAAECWRCADGLRTTIRRSQPSYRRLVALLSLRSLGLRIRERPGPSSGPGRIRRGGRRRRHVGAVDRDDRTDRTDMPDVT